MGPYRNLKRSLQRSFEMQIWKAISIGKFAGGIRCSRGSLCGPFDKGIQPDVGESPGAGLIAAPLYERSSIPIVQGKETSNNTAGSMTERLSIPYHFSRTARFSKSLIYDIGTEILVFHCFATEALRSFCKSIIFSGIQSSRRDLAFYSIKTRFKALFKNWPSWIHCYRFL